MASIGTHNVEKVLTSKYTFTESAILKVLSDGRQHTKAEVIACLPDELSTEIKVHIANIRQKIHPKGQDIVCLSKGNRRPVCYQLVKLLYVKVD